MPSRAFAVPILCLVAPFVTLPEGGGALAQVKVHTETIRPPATATIPPSANQFVLPGQDSSQERSPEGRSPEGRSPEGRSPESGPNGRAPNAPPTAETPTKSPERAAGPDVATDHTPVPPAVLHTRDRILAAARTGDLQTVLTLMRAGGNMPVFSHTQRQDPAAYWRETYPDSDGVEILSILTSILETEPARIDAGTPQETYLWPYFARLPIKSLTPAQKVDLFRVVTGSDYQQMLARGRYVFYQLGIGPDGTWRYFLASE
jgi:hypothetical protein